MKKSPPNKLYKYQPYNDQTLENLRNRHIYFSKPAKFNDPFDCCINFVLEQMSDTQWKDLYDELRVIWEKDVDQTFKKDMEPYFQGNNPGGGLKTNFSKVMSEIFRSEREKEIQERGIACFTERVDNILMWSHYADGHRGFCLEFDANSRLFNKVHPVKYSELLPVLDPKGKSEHPLMVLATTKSLGWSYEKEWRLFYEDGDTVLTYNQAVLTGLYFGCSMPHDRKQIIASILDGTSTQLYEAKTSETEFKVDFHLAASNTIV